LPEKTSETVDWDTPAHRATSMLVTRCWMVCSMAAMQPRGD
jgi:hypothetical protein